MEKLRGKFIVIDGTDGSGKATQAGLLMEKLKQAGYAVELADFPQYNTKSAGLVEEYLGGKYGSAEEIGPYRASIFYACDRFDASFKIKEWLKEGKIVISNRYVTANMGHQGGKIDRDDERQKYFHWLYQLEYELFGIPKPDLNIILHVPAEISQKLSQERTREDWKGKTNDIHQEDLDHLRRAEKVYLEIARSFPDLSLIECADADGIKSREEISGLVLDEVLKTIAGDDLQAGKPVSAHRFYEELAGPAKEPAPEDGFVYGRKIDSGTPSRIKPAEIPRPAGREKTFAPNFIEIYVNGEKQKNDGELVLKIEKIHGHAKSLTRAHASDAGLDIYACEHYSLVHNEIAQIRTGIKLAIPDSHVGLIWDKSGLARQGLHILGGVIDAGYRGEILVNIINLSSDLIHIAHGQKIAQILIQEIKTPIMIETAIDDQTDRGAAGHGSTGLF